MRLTKNMIAALLIASSLTLEAAVASKSVVTVNGVPITQKAVDREVRALIPQASYHASVSDSKMNELEKEAIENLINKELLNQYAKKEGMSVSPKELSKAEAETVKSLGGGKNFEQALLRAGITLSEFRSNLEVEVLIRKLYEEKIELTYSDDDLKAYYDKNRFKFKEPEKIDVQMIYTRNDPEVKDGGKIALKRAKEAMEKIKKGENFGVVAAEYSNDMTRIKEGKLGMIHKGRIPNAKAEKVAFSLKKGDISEIVETDIGCFIFRVNERREAAQLPFRKVKEKLRNELKSNREKEKMLRVLASLKKQAKIIK